MGSFTDYLEKKVLNALCGNGDPLGSISMWMGLFTAAPSDASGGTEVSGGNYARKSVGTWATAALGDSYAGLVNVTNTVFGTATGSWGNITHFALFDDSSTGNMLMWATLTSVRNVMTNDIVWFESAV